MPIESGHMPPFDGIRQNLKKRRMSNMNTIFDLCELFIKEVIYYMTADKFSLILTYIEFVFLMQKITYSVTKKFVAKNKFKIKITYIRIVNTVGKALCKAGKKLIKKSMLM